MIVIDIGNTNIVIGIYVKSKLSYIYRFETKSKKLLSKIKKTINKNNIGKYNIDYKLCVVSSVVPKISNTIVPFFKKIGLKVYNINYSNISTNIKLIITYVLFHLLYLKSAIPLLIFLKKLAWTFIILII